MKRFQSFKADKSYLLLGPRQVGKSTLVKQELKSEDLLINLLESGVYLELSKHRERFRAQVLAHLNRSGPGLCVVDEIQKIPELLDDVHDLIESTEMRFILTGSSARKLKRSGVNLLAGRALRKELFPCLHHEIGEAFDLERALGVGLLPKLWNGDLDDRDDALSFLDSYCVLYLREEVQQEGLVRNIGPFSRFMDVAAASEGEVVNFSNVARECAVSVKTAQEYFAILEDTFLAHRLEPWMKSARKRLTAHPKFYFFDPGVTNVLKRLNPFSLSPVERGRRFEQMVVLHALALNSYRQARFDLNFWRTHTGVEVDLVISREGRPAFALEMKSGAISSVDCRGLLSFKEEYPDVVAYLVVPGGRRFSILDGVDVVPWKECLDEIFHRG